VVRTEPVHAGQDVAGLRVGRLVLSRSWVDTPVSQQCLGGLRAMFEGCPAAGQKQAVRDVALADGRRVFAKAISAGQNPRSPGLYRREIKVMASLPVSVPAPRLRWSYDLAENFRSWHTIAVDPQLTARLDEWARVNLTRLVTLESRWVSAARGDTLLHADLRADNILLTDDSVMVVDWPYAVAGAPWVDGLLFLSSVAATGAVDPELAWRGFRPAHAADPDQVNSVLAAVAGDFLYQSLLPAPANLPTLRAHQHAKGMAAVTWLRRRIS
jgi:hypothetical protein